MTNMIMTTASFMLLALAARIIAMAIWMPEITGTAVYFAWGGGAMFLTFAILFAWFPLQDLIRTWREVRAEIRAEQGEG